jgi:hypothetical protein
VNSRRTSFSVRDTGRRFETITSFMVAPVIPGSRLEPRRSPCLISSPS